MEDDDINMLEEYSYSSVGEPFSLNVPNDSGAITFGLTPADGDGTTFNLTPATGDEATFNLTPAVENYGAISPEGFGLSSADDVQSFTLGQTIGVVQPINVVQTNNVVQPINVFPSQHRMVAAQSLESYPSMVPDQHPGTIQYNQPAQMHRHTQQPSPLHPQQPSPLHPQQPSPLHQQPSPLHPQQATPIHPQQPTSSSSHHPAAPMYQRPGDLQPVYSHELSNTINAMTFTPPIQQGTTSNFTPDFSSFLPLPPSPSNLPTHQSEPPRISLTEGVSGETSISLHSAYGLSNTISITRKQKLSPPVIPSQPPSTSPSTIPPHTATPPINIPVLMSPTATSPRMISPPTHLQYSQVSPRGRGPQMSPGASREPPSPVSNSRGAPPSPATSKHAPSSPVSARCISDSPRIPHSSPGSSPNPSFQNQPPGSSSPNRSFLNQPPGSSPNRSFLNQPPGSSPPNRPFLNQPPKSCSPNHSFLNHPPGSSPPNRSFVSQPPGNSPNDSFLNQPSPRHMSMSPAVHPSPRHMSMSPPKQPAKTPIAPPESHPSPQAQIRPPPPPKKLPSAQVSQEVIDPKDIPGVVMKKGNVDIGVFVNHIIQFKHRAFSDGEGFAERCLTCIIRKMKNSLPALKNLEMATRSLAGEPDPGCVLIPRMKDGRITIAKTGAGVGGNKKIYPHLALVQIFRAPEAQNYGMLASCGGCTSPFAARGMGDFPDTEKVCISPLHYTPVTQDSNKTRKPHKSPAATPKKVPNFKPIEGSTVNHAAYVKSVALHNEGISAKAVSVHNEGMKAVALHNEGMKAVSVHNEGISVKAVSVHNEGISKPVHRMEYINSVSHADNRNNIPEAKSSMDVMDEDDDYEDFDDGGIDWEAKWEKEAIDADTDGIQTFNEEDMLKEIEYLTLSKDANGKAAIVKAERELLEKLKVLDDLKQLINGNVNLDALIPIQEALHSEFKKDVISHDSHGPNGSSSRNFLSRDPGIGSDGRGGSRPDTSIGSHGPNGPRRDIYTGAHGFSHDTAGGPNGPVNHGPSGGSRGHGSPSRGTGGGSQGPGGPIRGTANSSQGPGGPIRGTANGSQGPGGPIRGTANGPQGPGGPIRGTANGCQGPSQRTVGGPAGPSSRTDESKEESAILNLLDDIKGSFERQFDMNLDDFGNDSEEHNFANQEFNMSNTFNMTDFSSSSQPPDMMDSNSSNPSSDNLLQYRSSNMGSSDAMFGGGLMEEEGGLPCIINSWSVTDQPQTEVERGFLTAGTITQEQFYTNMFDQENS